MYAIDLFCGAGGFSEGILQAGFHIVFSSDRSPYVQQTYEARHNQLGLIQGENTFFKLSDIRDLEGEEILNCINSLSLFKSNSKTFRPRDIDAIFGGPPCQGFSVAGKRDKSDPRNMLFREYLRVINYLMPKYIVMENVTGFMTMEVNPDFESFNNISYKDDELVKNVVTKELEAFGYTVLPPRILDASDYGVPQRRQRAIFLAYRNDVKPLNYPEATTPLPEQKLTVIDALKGVTVEGESDFSNQSQLGRTRHMLTGEPIAHLKSPLNMEESKHSPVIVERFSLFQQGESVNQLKNRLLTNKLHGNKVIDLEKLPNLLLETTFNLNKTFNKHLLETILIKKNIELEKDANGKSSLLESFYKRIIKLWNLDINSTEFINECKKNIGTKKFNVELIVEVFSAAKLKLNTFISTQDVTSWFNNENFTPQYVTHTNDEGELITEISYTQIPLFFNIGKAQLSWDEIINAVLTNKNTRTRLDGSQPGPTMVTLPDDFIHPLKNKILNVREMARIQSFDDSFEFLGKRTTGGEKRSQEVPQFTQVGNAVPPLLAYAIANEVKKALEKC
ncbi:DNA (cytosine-5-)-methyltransferase [Solibacillus sp. FSL R7-0668]|uniref:DNA (cytosine-5-)-methyltransferase n=1 Tax=Solibacillus sp. FSL R7-0668 TaxID=2921688 RepID=UPI0030F6CCEA